MITRVLLLFVLTVLPITTTAGDPELWESAIKFTGRKGFNITMPPYLMKYFQFPQPEKIKGKEIQVAVWLMAVFQPQGYPKPMILVRRLTGEILCDEYGVDSNKGKAWLLDSAGNLEKNCQWVNEQVVGRVQDAQEWDDLGMFIKSMRELLLSEIFNPPRE